LVWLVLLLFFSFFLGHQVQVVVHNKATKGRSFHNLWQMRALNFIRSKFKAKRYVDATIKMGTQSEWRGIRGIVSASSFFFIFWCAISLVEKLATGLQVHSKNGAEAVVAVKVEVWSGANTRNYISHKFIFKEMPKEMHHQLRHCWRLHLSSGSRRATCTQRVFLPPPFLKYFGSLWQHPPSQTPH